MYSKVVVLDFVYQFRENVYQNHESSKLIVCTIPYIAQLSQKKMVHKKNILRRKFIKINDARDNHVSFDKLVV